MHHWTTETTTIWLNCFRQWIFMPLHKIKCIAFNVIIINFNFDQQFHDQFTKFKFWYLNSYCSRIFEPLSPECRLEGIHLLWGCGQWAYSLWPCGTVPCSFSLPMIKTHPPNLLKELKFLLFVLHSWTSNLTLSPWAAEVWRNLNWSNFAGAILECCCNFLFL